MTFTIAAVGVALIGFIAGNVGSFSSIRAAWHAQHIYHRCVMPSIHAVCLPPQAAGAVLGVGIVWVFELLQWSLWIGAAAAGVACAAIAFTWARRRGMRIYSANVRRIAPELAP